MKVGIRRRGMDLKVILLSAARQFRIGGGRGSAKEPLRGSWHLQCAKGCKHLECCHYNLPKIRTSNEMKRMSALGRHPIKISEWKQREGIALSRGAPLSCPLPLSLPVTNDHVVLLCARRSNENKWGSKTTEYGVDLGRGISMVSVFKKD